MILVIVNFVVITKGSGRIAEVAALFNFDAAGKQWRSMPTSPEVINEPILLPGHASGGRNLPQRGDAALKVVRGDPIAACWSYSSTSSAA